MATVPKSGAVCLILALLFGCLFILVAAGGAGAGMSPSPLRLVSGQERYEVGPHLEILPDPDNRWTIEDVSSPSFDSAFSPVRSSTLNLGMVRTTIWLRFAIAGNPPGAARRPSFQPWLLDLGWHFFDSADFYLLRPLAVDGKRKIEKFSFGEIYHPFAGKKLEKPGIVVRLPRLSSPEQAIYLKLSSDAVFFLHPVVCTVRNYLETSTLRMLWFGLYFGMLAALLLYNLFLYFCLRDRSYLWYVTSIAAIGLYFLGAGRLTYEFLVDFPPVAAMRLNLVLLGTSMAALLLFARSFLQVREKVPLLDRIILGVIFVQVAVMVTVSFAPLVFLQRCYALLGNVITLLLITTAFVCWCRGYQPARFLVLSWVLYGIGGMIYILTFCGVLPFTGLNYHSLQIGSALEAVLLSFALAGRINLLRREREELSRSERRHRELAITDSLTGLYNLRYFRAQIDLELELADRLAHKLTLMMLDVDNFKLFNDRYGHPEGDKVLATLGRIMSSCVREKDVPCRYGGEEFAIILPGGQNSTAVEIYERINVELARHSFGAEGEKAGRVTLSIGVAEHIFGEGAETLLQRADQALYEAKARGRNQIIIASCEPEAAFFACITEFGPEDRSSPQTPPEEPA
jgi:diguanylate cyclase (GGDEF)-like protein